MAKILSVHQIYCRVNQRTQLSFNGKLGDELCLAVKELSKTRRISPLPNALNASRFSEIGKSNRIWAIPS